MAALSQTLPPARRRRAYGLHLRLTVTKLFLRDVRRTIVPRRWNAARYANAILRDAWRRWPEATAMTLQVALLFVLLLAWHFVRLSRPM